jgi:hypothetical protein
MAVLDIYLDSGREAGNLGDRKTQGGGELTVYPKTATIASGDDDGSVFRICTVTDNAIPALRSSFVKISSAITGGTSYKIGLYDTNSGEVVDDDLLMTSTSFASIGDKELTVTATNMSKPLWELLGGTASAGKQYDVCLTAATIGTAAGVAGIELGFIS